jgi:hypothetical protein
MLGLKTKKVSSSETYRQAQRYSPEQHRYFHRRENHRYQNELLIINNHKQMFTKRENKDWKPEYENIISHSIRTT